MLQALILVIVLFLNIYYLWQFISYNRADGIKDVIIALVLVGIAYYAVGINGINSIFMFLFFLILTILFSCSAMESLNRISINNSQRIN